MLALVLTGLHTAEVVGLQTVLAGAHHSHLAEVHGHTVAVVVGERYAAGAGIVVVELHTVDVEVVDLHVEGSPAVDNLAVDSLGEDIVAVVIAGNPLE